MPIHSEYTESFSEFTQKTKVDILQRKNSDQVLRSPKFKRSIILLFLTYFKVTQNQIKHSTTIVHLKTQSNLYEVNSSRHYKCKGLFTEEFQQYFRIAESSDSQGEDRISKSLQQQLETSERFRTISHFLLNTIGNNKQENSLKRSCHLRPSLNTTQTCESVFKLRTTIDHTGHLCIPLSSKLLIKQTKLRQQKTIVNELF